MGLAVNGNFVTFRSLAQHSHVTDEEAKAQTSQEHCLRPR